MDERSSEGLIMNLEGSRGFFGKDFLGFQGSENKKIQGEFEVQST
jgi:hypothetical protein